MDWDAVLREHEATLANAWKVRVRLGECRHMGYWHGTIEDGVVGFIIRDAKWITPGAPADHTHLVYFDQPIRGRVVWSYSAAELVPVTIEELLDTTT